VKNWWKKLLGKETPEYLTFPAEDVEQTFVPDPDQVDRKAKSESILRRQQIPINEHLPFIESENETTVRSPTEIRNRLLALSAIAGIATDDERKPVEEFISDKSITSYFTPMERDFYHHKNPEMQRRIQFSWQYECAWVLLWALKLDDNPLGFPDTPCSVTRLIEVVCTTDDLTGKGVRSKTEILDEADLIYRYHWAVRQAGLDGKEDPEGLHGGVVMERHRALNWLVGYNDGADWDDVTTDT
jgi:hypothetical protein